MKKLLALTALAALSLTGCGADTPAPVMPVPTQVDPATNITQRLLDADDNEDGLYEYTGVNSDGVPFRCYVTDRYQAVAQTCFEYPKVK